MRQIWKPNKALIPRSGMVFRHLLYALGAALACFGMFGETLDNNHQRTTKLLKSIRQKIRIVPLTFRD